MKNKKASIHAGMKNEYVNIHTDEQQMCRLNPLIQILIIKTLHFITAKAFYNVEKQIYPYKKKPSFIQTIAKYKPLDYSADLSVPSYKSKIDAIRFPLIEDVLSLLHRTGSYKTWTHEALYHPNNSDIHGMKFYSRLAHSTLLNYASFTQEHVSSIAKIHMPLVRKSMYREAYRAGKCLRTILFIRNDTKARRLLFWLYKNIGIDLTGHCPGTVYVTCCYFSQFYTPSTCQIMSAMDKGIFAGLFGGGSLVFEERITEGFPCCKANFKK